ncbi:hypothetical protein Acr_20g0002330 [Actinidia rufa]|uniref:Uncharacterized protein n=1 Tax=Actinidia rufa TaxID=165716 RepID=A0A7J0GC82_9ERIC|nr:hypothetical protein Acr_20g0002330 [Actinidia rufa]
MAPSPSASEGQLLPRSEVESQLSSIVFAFLDGTLHSEIDENSTGIMEEIAKCKDNALEKKKTLEEWKESFQKAASTVLDMLNNNDIR